MSYPKPTPELLKWHDYELGVFFHYDIEVFQPEWTHENRENLPPASIWNPSRLNTDQWLQAAKAAGARYALLTAKHSTGFCLWPTKQHDYHVGNTPSGRDVVGEFIASCEKYGIAPGLYYSLGGEHLRQLHTGSDGVLDREGFNKVLLAQVEELVTGYGPLVEMWFDGGVLRPERGGPDIPGLMNRIAPDIVYFGGCPGLKNVIRWSGSEQGVAVPECWSTAHFQYEEHHANVTCDSPGDPEDPLWAPVEVDIPSRDVLTAYMGGWMYHDDDADKTYSGDYLFARYLTSVGRNANLLIGSVPNREGLISQDQVQALADLGAKVHACLGTPLASTTKLENGAMELYFEKPVDVAYAELLEDQAHGQHVHGWVLEALWPEEWNEQQGRIVWFPLEEGKAIGHKRIIQLNAMRVKAIRVRITKGRDCLRMREFRVFGSEVY